MAAWDATGGQSGSVSINQFQYAVGVATSSANLPADGASTSTVTATITNPNTGAPIAGDTVTFTPSGAACSSTGAVGPVSTNASGQASMTYTAGTSVGSCTITAAEASTVHAASTTINQFQYAVAVVANPASILANGTSTSLVTVTVTNPITLQPVSGNAVTLALTGAACSGKPLSPAGPYTTNAAGQVAVTYTSGTVAGSCTATATESKTRKSGSATITQT